MLAIVMTLGIGLDQWSKSWASDSLATPDHPLPVTIRADEVGQPVGDVLRARFGLDDSALYELAERGPLGLARVRPAYRCKQTDMAYPGQRGASGMFGYWVFDQRSLDKAPRRFPQYRNEAQDFEQYKDATLSEYLQASLPWLDEAALQELFSEYVYRFDPIQVHLNEPVQAGWTYLVLSRDVSVIEGFFQFHYAENPGAAWGIFADQSSGFRVWFFSIVSIVAFAVIGTFFFRLETGQRLSAWGFSLILSGAAGNFIDRVRFRHVIDYMDIYTGTLHWPTFNVADVAITVGGALLLLEAIVNPEVAFLTRRRPARLSIESDQQAE